MFGASPESNGNAPDEPASSDTAALQLPSDFPNSLPRYPNAALVSVIQPDRASTGGENLGTGTTQTQWETPDSAEQVQQFYKTAFQTDGWQLIEPVSDSNVPQSLVAEREGLRVTVAIASTVSGATEFSIDYPAGNDIAENDATTNDAVTAQAPSPEASTSTNPDFIGPVPPENWGRSNSESTSSPAVATGSQVFTDLAQAPAELQPYITDLANLGAFSPTTGGEFKPNEAITRREYARWLATANNLIYANQPARKIRLGVSSDQPSFQDVPTSDPDFGAIQGLANAGLIPSPISGASTEVTFRPDAPLTREDLIRWKVPVDLRQALPNATIDAVQQTWGFQDTARINPEALRAILADFQNGDLSNIRRAFGYTTLFQPSKPVTRAEAAAVLWFFGSQGNGLSAKDAL